MDFKICMSSRFDTELPSDTISITNVVERLDIEMLLQRAAQGILDLNAFRAPASADVVGGASSEALKDLLHEPDQPLNHVFGVDRETASKSLQNLLQTAESSLIDPKEEKGDKDVKDDEPSDNVDHE